MQERLDCRVLSCRGRDKLFKNSLVVGRHGRHVVHDSSEGLDEVVRRDSAWWSNLGVPPGCCCPHGVSVVCNAIDVRSDVCRYEGIHGGVGMTDDALERLLCVL